METLKYHLIESKMKYAPGVYLAKPLLQNSCTFNKLIDNMLKRGTSLTKTDIVAVINLYYQECEAQIASGRPLNLPLFNGTPVISGTFTGPNDVFDSKRHSIKYRITPGIRMRKAITKLKTEKINYEPLLPVVTQFYDVTSQSANTIVTPKGIEEIKGSSLKLKTNDLEQGIFFIAPDKTEFRIAVVALNKPAKLIFQIPDLPAGKYQLEVRVKFPNSSVLRILSLKKELTV